MPGGTLHPIFRCMIPRSFRHIVAPVAAIALIPWLGGCDTKEAQAVTAQPTAVTVSQPLQQTVADFVEFTGTTAPNPS